jgi:hypothetical protein
MKRKDYNFISELVSNSERIFIKKLAANDISWANGGSHQGGLYIKAEDRDSGFFPDLKLVDTSTSKSLNPNKEAIFNINWKDFALTKPARLVHYVGKGPETHLTRLCKDSFVCIEPSSLFILGKNGLEYNAYVLPTDSDEYQFFEDYFEIDDNFISKVFSPKLSPISNDKADPFWIEVKDSYAAGFLDSFLKEMEKMPDALTLAKSAQEIFLRDNNKTNLNPFELERVGDIIVKLSREIEYDLFKRRQFELNCVDLMVKLLGSGSEVYESEVILKRIMDGFKDIDSMFLSATQQRRSRAGYSFEYHIEKILSDGQIPFDKQVFEGSSKPDFIVPSLDEYNKNVPGNSFVLSAKTTLRERWRQVLKEGRNCDVYLATVDDKISPDSLRVLNDNNVVVVVPESVKDSKFSVYGRFDNVITFDEFFKSRVTSYPFWNLTTK